MSIAQTLTPYFQVRPRIALDFEQPDLTVAASTTINIGDIVKYDGSGNIVQAIATPSSGVQTAAGAGLVTVGVAMGSIVTTSSGAEATTGRTTVPVATWDQIQVAMRTTGATYGTSKTPADFTYATPYQFARVNNGTSTFYALIPTTTSGELVYDEIVLGVNSTDTYGPVWVHCVSAYSAFNQ